MSDESPTGRTRGPDGGQSVHEFSVLGMHCADCSMTIAADLESLEGVHGVKVMLGSGRVRVVYDPDTMEPGRLEARVRALGYTTVQPTGEAGEGALERGELWAAVLAGALLGAGLLLDWLFPAQLSSALPAMRAGHIAFAASMVAGGYHVGWVLLCSCVLRCGKVGVSIVHVAQDGILRYFNRIVSPRRAPVTGSYRPTSIV